MRIIFESATPTTFRRTFAPPPMKLVFQRASSTSQMGTERRVLRDGEQLEINFISKPELTRPIQGTASKRSAPFL